MVPKEPEDNTEESLIPSSGKECGKFSSCLVGRTANWGLFARRGSHV
jgi:hypothetical protein